MSLFGRIPALALFIAVASVAAQQAPASSAKTIEIRFKSHDGYPMTGKLVMPDSEGLRAAVIYVQTAEGMTIDMRRPKPGGTFDYFDVYRDKLTEMNVAFFSYEGRGIRMGDELNLYS